MDMSQLQVRERERAGERERERTVCCIDVSGHTEYSFFLLYVLYKLKMVQLCSIERNLPMCSNISCDTESGFLLFKV